MAIMRIKIERKHESMRCNLSVVRVTSLIWPSLSSLVQSSFARLLLNVGLFIARASHVKQLVLSFNVYTVSAMCRLFIHRERHHWVLWPLLQSVCPHVLNMPPFTLRKRVHVSDFFQKQKLKISSDLFVFCLHFNIFANEYPQSMF